MSAEKPGPSPEEQMNFAIDQARASTQEAGMYSQNEMGQARSQLSTHEYMSDKRDYAAPFVAVETRTVNNEGRFGSGINNGKEQGEFVSKRVVATTDKTKFVDDESARNGFRVEGSKYRVEHGQHVDYKGVSRESGSVTVERRDANGQRYEHTFKNPKTARKFATLITKQVIARAKNAPNQEKAA